MEKPPSDETSSEDKRYERFVELLAQNDNEPGRREHQRRPISVGLSGHSVDLLTATGLYMGTNMAVVIQTAIDMLLEDLRRSEGFNDQIHQSRWSDDSSTPPSET